GQDTPEEWLRNGPYQHVYIFRMNRIMEDRSQIVPQGRSKLPSGEVAIALFPVYLCQSSLQCHPTAGTALVMLIYENKLSLQHSCPNASHRSRSQTPVSQHLIDISDVVVFGDSEPQITVFRGAHGLVKRTRYIEAALSEQDRRAKDVGTSNKNIDCDFSSLVLLRKVEVTHDVA